MDNAIGLFSLGLILYILFVGITVTGIVTIVHIAQRNGCDHFLGFVRICTGTNEIYVFVKVWRNRVEWRCASQALACFSTSWRAG